MKCAYCVRSYSISPLFPAKSIEEVSVVCSGCNGERTPPPYGVRVAALDRLANIDLPLLDHDPDPDRHLYFATQYL